MKARMRLFAMLGAVLALVALSPGAAAQNTYTLPLVLAADVAGLTSFMRIINHAAQAGTVVIHAIDDTGRRFGPVSLAIGVGHAVHFTSSDLERGNPSKGFASGVGDGSGNWRLEFTTTLDIQPLAYIRTADGFVTAMHDVAPVSGIAHSIPFFNPGSNTRQVSRLRILNPGTVPAQVTISGRDDAGEFAPGGTVRMFLPAGDSRMLTAQDLEAGGDGFEGSLGDGAGKWRLTVEADRTIEVMSLLQSPTGHLANLSTVRDTETAGTPPSEHRWGAIAFALPTGDSGARRCIINDGRVSATAAVGTGVTREDAGIRAVRACDRLHRDRGYAGGCRTVTFSNIGNPGFGPGSGRPDLSCGSIAQGYSVRRRDGDTRCGVSSGWGLTALVAEASALDRCRRGFGLDRSSYTGQCRIAQNERGGNVTLCLTPTGFAPTADNGREILDPSGASQ